MHRTRDTRLIMITLSECKPGAIVECVDAANCPELTRGAVYSIDHAQVVDPSNWGVRLCEVPPPRGYAGFDRNRFRIVPDSRLAVFRALLVSRPVADHVDNRVRELFVASVAGP